MWIDKVLKCGCTIRRSDFNNDVEIEFCEKHSMEAKNVAKNVELSDRVAELESVMSDAYDALIWCGGSADFAPEGQARLGWERVVIPVLEKLRELYPSPSPSECQPEPTSL